MSDETQIAIQRDNLAKLLPTGLAWPREQDTVLMRLLEGLGTTFAELQDRLDQIMEEADPRTSIEMLGDWESALGLPDDCVTYDPVYQERITAVLQRYLSEGGQSKAYFEGLAEDLGYPVTIEELRPLRCGDYCGDALGGGPADRHYWYVTVHEPRVTYARAGESCCGDYLATVRQAEDLECLFDALKPAHTILIFIYEETA